MIDNTLDNGGKPFLLTPASKDYLWGGTRLRDDFNLDSDADPFAEAWVCSTHPDGESKLFSSGRPLSQVLEDHPEYLGTHVLQITEGRPMLPILIKLIDARSDLSLQVHPDDEYARIHENSWGKTEMWYVLSAGRGTELIYGFNRDVTAEEVRKNLENGKVSKLLNHVKVHKNDLFFIESGTVHAIGAGCLVAEIQQSSNITYRLYDYDRVDKDGNRRPLHVDKALEVANLKSSASPRQPMRVLKYSNGYASELLTRCRYFQVERFILNTESRRLAEFSTGSNSFHALLCVDGCGVLFGEDIYLPFFKGDCIFVPAMSVPLKLHGKAQILDVSC